MMENPFRHLPYRAAAILVAAMTLVTGTLVSLARGGHFSVQAYVYALTYTVACAFWIGIILGFVYQFITGLRKAYFYTLFAALIVVGTALGTQTASLIIHKRLYAGPRITAFSFVVSLGLSILAIANEHLRDSFTKRVSDIKEEEMESEILKRCEAEAKMKSLEARLDPYFLLNSLDTIAGVVRNDPKLAERNISRLSNLYRRALSMPDQALVPVSEVIGLLKDYLELEGQRLGAKLRYAIDCPEELTDARIPGLVLAPLVENSIKHGSTDRPLNVKVKVWREGKHLMLRVTDDGRGFDQTRIPFGLGLFGIQQRLKRTYGDAYGFEIESVVDEGTTVTIGLTVS